MHHVPHLSRIALTRGQEPFARGQVVLQTDAARSFNAEVTNRITAGQNRDVLRRFRPRPRSRFDVLDLRGRRREGERIGCGGAAPL